MLESFRMIVFAPCLVFRVLGMPPCGVAACSDMIQRLRAILPAGTVLCSTGELPDPKRPKRALPTTPLQKGQALHKSIHKKICDIKSVLVRTCQVLVLLLPLPIAEADAVMLRSFPEIASESPSAISEKLPRAYRHRLF